MASIAAENDIKIDRDSTQDIHATKEGVSSFLLDLPPELRNMIYGYCFPTLPAHSIPLDNAHNYRPDTSLTVANHQFWNEANGYVRLVVNAWRQMTWSVDLDVLTEEFAWAHALWSEIAVLPSLSKQDAEMVQAVQFTTTAFSAPRLVRSRWR